MTTHTHPEIHADILERSKATASEIGDSEERLRVDIYKIRDELKSDIAGLQTSVGGLETSVGGLETSVGGLETSVGGLSARMGSLELDVKAMKDVLLPPKP